MPHSSIDSDENLNHEDGRAQADGVTCCRAEGKITVNGVLPSIIYTAANRASMPKADPAKWVAPKELADVILFLVSDTASAVAGALLPVNGQV